LSLAAQAGLDLAVQPGLSLSAHGGRHLIAPAGSNLIARAGLALIAQAQAAGQQAAAGLLWALAAVLVALGLVGTVVPKVPGPLLVFLGLLLGAWADGFSRVGPFTLVLLAVLAVAAFVLELLAAHHGARRSGASPLAIAGATLGTLVGLFFSLPGLLIGPFLGAFLGELLMRRGFRQAGRSGFGAWLGLLLAAAARAAIVLAMLGLFAFAYLLG
jgi:uncharacterized protein YqgC (DUF456 family)